VNSLKTAVSGFFLISSILLPLLNLKAESSTLSLQTNSLKVDLNSKGELTSIYDKKNNVDYLHPKHKSYLLQLRRYSEQNIKPPSEMKIVSTSEKNILIELIYDSETSLTVLLSQEDGWLHFEIKKAKGVNDIDAVRWGPYYTTITGAVGGFFGILHADSSTLGLITLDTNTCGQIIENNKRVNLHSANPTCAAWLTYPEKGSYVLLDSIDHTRKRPIAFLRSSSPLKNATVIGSKVALFLAPKGEELDSIEKIVKKEKLPYPKFGGKWAKYSKKILSPSVWSWYDEKSVNKVIDFCAEIGGDNICPFAHMFGNWGHFDLDPKIYPGGWDAIIKINKQSKKLNIKTTLYTLSNFLKPITIPEPFITPEVDQRLERYDTTTQLTENIAKDTKKIHIKADSNLEKLLGKNKNSENTHVLLLLENEIIWYSEAVVKENLITLNECKRGYLMTTPGSHKKDSEVQFLLYSGYKNLFPGNYEMNSEVATIIGQRAEQGGFMKITLDGHESCLQTGLGPFAMNDYQKKIYEINKDREVLYTGSCLQAYCWYIISYISWGEFDKFKGFRGTMLDYRIRRQVELERSLMPHKLGQHYPDNATLEDINWLMAMAVGWNSGVEFDMRINEFNKNPESDTIKKAIHKWESARLSGSVTDAQKLCLVQVDSVYDIIKKGNEWELKLLERWSDKRCKKLPPSVIKLHNTSGNQNIKAASIDLTWTHNPLIYQSAAISDDIPLFAGKENKWQVTYPEAGAKSSDINRNQFKFVLRVPKSSPVGIKNPLFSIDGAQNFMVPVDLKPGEYIATPLNVPIAFVYNEKHQPIKKVMIKYRNDLPNLCNKVNFTLTCSFTSQKEEKKPIAILNLFYTETLKNK